MKEEIRLLLERNQVLEGEVNKKEEEIIRLRTDKEIREIAKRRKSVDLSGEGRRRDRIISTDENMMANGDRSNLCYQNNRDDSLKKRS